MAEVNGEVRNWDAFGRKEAISSEQLIYEIEKRPSIWDSSSEDYAKRDVKRKHWLELVDIFSEADASEDNKRKIGK